MTSSTIHPDPTAIDENELNQKHIKNNKNIDMGKRVFAALEKLQERMKIVICLFISQSRTNYDCIPGKKSPLESDSVDVPRSLSLTWLQGNIKLLILNLTSLRSDI